MFDDGAAETKIQWRKARARNCSSIARECAKGQHDGFQQEMNRLGMFRMLVKDAPHIVLSSLTTSTAKVLYANNAPTQHLHIHASSVVRRYAPILETFKVASMSQPIRDLETDLSSLCVPDH